MERHPIGDLTEVTLTKIKEMVDVNTIVGAPITTPDGTTLIPISKVTFGFGSGEFVANALGRHLALELREGQKDIEGQTPHARRRVKGLRDRDEACSGSIEHVHDLGKIGERAG